MPPTGNGPLAPLMLLLLKVASYFSHSFPLPGSCPTRLPPQPHTRVPFTLHKQERQQEVPCKGPVSPPPPPLVAVIVRLGGGADAQAASDAVIEGQRHWHTPGPGPEGAAGWQGQETGERTKMGQANGKVPLVQTNLLLGRTASRVQPSKEVDTVPGSSNPGLPLLA